MVINKNKYSIIVPVINETYSLEKTIEILIEDNEKDIFEIIIISSKSKTTKESIKVINNLKENNKKLIKSIYQELPFIGGAIRKGFDFASGTHIIMMASDLETDPSDVKKMIHLSKKSRNSIITANRWIKGGNFTGYNPIKLILNYIFQFLLKIIFFTNLSDLTYGFRLFPSYVVKNIDWKELKHPFLLETLLKPLKNS